MSQPNSRRRFLASSAAAALATPLLLPSRTLGREGQTAPNSRVRLACIGVGGMGTGNLQAFLNDERVELVAVCDVDAHHREAARNLAGLKEADAGRDFREVLARSDVDAVMNATPDHWHACIATAAAAAGKDLYTEKPLGGSIADSRAITQSVAKYRRVLQCGTWRRSVLKTRLACEWVRNGYIGELREIEIGVPGTFAISGGFTGLEPPQEVPPHLDYDLWLGPARHTAYTAARCHFNFRWINDYAPGYITDWGAHFLDVAQWGAGQDEAPATAAPIAVSATAVTHRPEGIYDAPESFRIEYRYPKGPRLVMFSTTDQKKWGVRFIGTAGTVFTENERLETDPASLRTVKLKEDDVRLFESKNHHRNFIDAVLSRGPTAAPAPVAHRAATLCHLGAISAALGRPVSFDPVAENFGSDEPANQLLASRHRDPWQLTT